MQFSGLPANPRHYIEPFQHFTLHNRDIFLIFFNMKVYVVCSH